MSKEIRQDHIDEMISIWPLQNKVAYSSTKIKEFIEWCDKNGEREIVIGFSGGKDSTAMLDLVYKVHKSMKTKTKLILGYATEITFPDTMRYIKEVSDLYRIPLEIFPPKMGWKQILTDKGFPFKGKRFSVLINRLIQSKTKNNLVYDAFGMRNIHKAGTDKADKKSIYYILKKDDLFLLDKDMVSYIISEKCCDYVKGGIKHDKRPAFVGTQASESYLRKTKWLQNGCNVFGGEKPQSKPLSIWTAKDVWDYMPETLIGKYNPMYEHFDRLGCISCTFGSHLEQKAKNRKKNPISENRFDILYRINKDLYNSQVWDTGIYIILADMNIKVDEDKEYMKFYKQRRKEISNWYENLDENLMKVMARVTMNKGFEPYTYSEVCEAYEHYKLEKPSKELYNKYFGK